MLGGRWLERGGNEFVENGFAERDSSQYHWNSLPHFVNHEGAPLVRFAVNDLAKLKGCPPTTGVMLTPKNLRDKIPCKYIGVVISDRLDPKTYDDILTWSETNCDVASPHIPEKKPKPKDAEAAA